MLNNIHTSIHSTNYQQPEYNTTHKMAPKNKNTRNKSSIKKFDC